MTPTKGKRTGRRPGRAAVGWKERFGSSLRISKACHVEYGVVVCTVSGGEGQKVELLPVAVSPFILPLRVDFGHGRHMGPVVTPLATSLGCVESGLEQRTNLDCSLAK